MNLSESLLRSIEPDGTMRRLWDGAEGLYAQVSPRGVIAFIVKIRDQGRERRIGLGRWPAEISLAQARRKARALRVDLNRGISPGIDVKPAEGATFEAIADEWLRTNEAGMAPRHAAGVRRYLKALKGSIGAKNVREIESADVLAVIRKAEAEGKHETAHRLRIYASVVFAYACATGRARYDPAAPLKARGVMAPKPRVVGHVAMPLPEIRPFLLALADSKAGPSARLALRFTILTALRTNETLGLRWEDLTESRSSLTIPAERMKGGRAHTVILSRQAGAVLDSMERISKGRPFIFTGRDPDGPLSNMSLLVALSRAYAGRATVHGFRAAFSTWAHASGAAPLVIERCLAHVQGDRVAAAYNRHAFDAEAGALWQAWADAITP